MPNICTHLIFGARVAEATQKSFASSDGMYALGCLGPDWYFYDRLPPTPFIPHQKKHGNALHQLDCFQLFSALRDAADPSLRPYLYGFLTHIALDSTLHPYVESSHRGGAHARFEGVIDSIVFRQNRDRFPFYKVFRQKTDPRAIDALLTEVSQQLLEKNVSGAYTRGVRKFRRISRLMYDPKSRRYRFLRGIEKRFRRPGLVSDFLIGPDHEDADDCMNLSRKSWTSPFDPSLTRDLSVPMLIGEAESLAIALFQAFDANDDETLSRLLRGRTMQKGVLPC